MKRFIFSPRTIWVSFSLFFTLIVSAQKEVFVKQYICSKQISVTMPVFIDSTDINKKSFEEKDLLKTDVSLKELLQKPTILKADSAGVVQLPYFSGWKAIYPMQNKGIQLLAFYLDADRYCKVKAMITCTDPFEVYVNSKKEKSKESKEDSISKSRTIELDITLEPRQNMVVIKQLTSVQNFNQSELKTIIQMDKKYSLAQVVVSTGSKRRITIYDILEGDRLSGSGLSPSGNFCLVTLNTVYPGGKSAGYTELRHVKSNRMFYRFPSSVRPVWLPTVDKLVYSKDGKKEKDLILFDPEKMEEETIAEDISFESFRFSPDNQYIIISQQDKIPEEKGDLKRLLSPSDRAGSYRERNSLYMYVLENKLLKRITFGKTHTTLSDIRPDGKKIVFMTLQEDLNERLFTKKVLYEMDIWSLEIDTLIQDPYISSSNYSPDGKQLLILGGAESFNSIGSTLQTGQIPNSYDIQMYIFDLKTRKVKPISRDFNPSINTVQWSTFDRKIYCNVEDEDRIQMYVYDDQTEKFQKLPLPEDIISGFQVARNAPVALFRGQSATNAYRLYSYDLKTHVSSLLADPFNKQLSEIDLHSPKDWNFTASNGSVIKGHYYLPHNFQPNQKYPMIVYFYGGTSPTRRVFESTYPLQTYAALGYVVYTLQPSGTTGFGQEFSARHVNAWGKITADEIIEGTQKFCEEFSFVDNKKIGCIGASYGGFMTQYLQTKTDLFAAAVSHAGISSITSYWGEGYWGYAYSAIASAGSFPWNNPQLYVEQSPLFHADKINTPLLLLHGSGDTNVPIGESVQMYNALKLLGKEVEFIRVEGENHSIQTYQKRIDWNKTIHAWFAKWLKNQPEWWEVLYPNP